VAGTMAGELIVGVVDKEAQKGETLEQLARDTAAQIDQKQAQIRKQLEELRDNRLQRHFRAGSGKMPALRPEAELQDQDQPQAQQMVAGDQYSVQYGYGRPGSRQRGPQVQRAVTVPGAAVDAEEEAARLAPERDPSDGLGLALADLQPYTAKGIYSLPVTLPEGEVRLDFARPSGEAELSLWAVPLSTIHNLYATIAILAALLAIVALVKIWPRPQSRQPTSAKRIIGYGLLSVALSLVLGVSGVLVSLVVIVLCEARRGAFVPHAAGTSQK
ncbi:MAG: hypothetical protein ACYTAO_09355, partial [Planctomycetota bacterium]